jgi:DNA-binding transcriptional MerR regulator
MAIYSIGDLERLSGIKAHTIRMWEQRYGLLHPKRTDTRIRYYEDEDLQYLLNVVLLNKRGVRISKIAKMSLEELGAEVERISQIKLGHDTSLNLLTLAFVEMDEYKFNTVFNHYAAINGLEETLLEVIYPFLEKLSLMWLTGAVKPVQENFFTQLVRNKLIAEIEKTALPSNAHAAKCMLYLPKGEQQELSILLVQLLMRRRGILPINIGEDTGLMDVEDAFRIHKPQYLFTILSETFTDVPVEQYLNSLSDLAADASVLVSGYQVAAEGLALPDNVKSFPDLDSLKHFLDSIAA